VNDRTRRLLGRAAAFGVGAAVVVALLVLGPRSTERSRRLDDVRVDQLSAIARTVDLVYARTGRLPASLEEVGTHGGDGLAVADPQTGRPYRYQVKGPAAFSVCAEFQHPSDGRSPDFWRHGAGPMCFDLEPEEIRR
jgi:hypothetical protein